MRTKGQMLRLEMLETRRFLDGGALGAAGEPAPDFTLTDVNPTSSTYNQPVQLSANSGNTAVYFTHAG